MPSTLAVGTPFVGTRCQQIPPGRQHCLRAHALSAPNLGSAGGLNSAGGLRQAPSPHRFSGSSGGDSSSSTSAVTPTLRRIKHYSRALEMAREQEFDKARRIFEATVSFDPSFAKAWVSWAQMEKRSAKGNPVERFARCRAVLQRALTANPNSPPLLQAWGLMELQRGNYLAAVLLLERSASMEPRNQPVLRWQPVVEARMKARSSSRQQRGSASASCGSSSGGGTAKTA